MNARQDNFEALDGVVRDQGERMTRQERSDLAALIRRREKVAKTHLGSVKAERLAQLEVDLASAFAAEDERRAKFFPEVLCSKLGQ